MPPGSKHWTQEIPSEGSKRSLQRTSEKAKQLCEQVIIIELLLIRMLL
jgi:hypothetical protein